MLQGQTSKSPEPTRHLRFEKLRELPQGAVDSLLTVKATPGRVTLTMAFDNRCGFRPEGRYTIAADTLFFTVRYKARDAATCPGGQWFQAFAASTDTLQQGSYTVRIVVEQRGARETRVYNGRVDI